MYQKDKRKPSEYLMGTQVELLHLPWHLVKAIRV